MNLIKRVIGKKKPSKEKEINGKIDKVKEAYKRNHKKEIRTIDKLNLTLENAKIEITVDNFDKIIKELQEKNA